jgi:drug/metabolite transporter (DMT)-like permease
MKPLVLLFVAGAIFSWGIYVPTVHEGSKLLGAEKPSSLRAFFCVGVAYFLVAILVPLVFMWKVGVPGQFNVQGSILAGLAGVAGAAGALCVIFALQKGGTPWLVAPLVFAGAPIVNAVVSGIWHPPAERPSPLYFAGMVLAAAGMFMVFVFKPAAADAAPKAASPAAAVTTAAPAEGTTR